MGKQVCVILQVAVRLGFLKKIAAAITGKKEQPKKEKKAEQPKALYVRVIRPDTQEVFHIDGLFVYGTPAA